ncbi:MAG: hypothetical protein J07HX64_00244 [halophilic archaeon J07HX64]|nr:MAG: hypothetical protein J07HX64_00244 [halophilic archaeon J07HX64]
MSTDSTSAPSDPSRSSAGDSTNVVDPSYSTPPLNG